MCQCNVHWVRVSVWSQGGGCEGETSKLVWLVCKKIYSLVLTSVNVEAMCKVVSGGE